MLSCRTGLTTLAAGGEHPGRGAACAALGAASSRHAVGASGYSERQKASAAPRHRRGGTSAGGPGDHCDRDARRAGRGRTGRGSYHTRTGVAVVQTRLSRYRRRRPAPDRSPSSAFPATHDRITMAGNMVAIGSLYIGSAWGGIHRGWAWARTALLLSGPVGFPTLFYFLLGQRAGRAFPDPLHRAHPFAAGIRRHPPSRRCARTLPGLP